MTFWRPLMDWRPIQDEVVKATLECLLDVRNHPILLIDPLVRPHHTHSSKTQ